MEEFFKNYGVFILLGVMVIFMMRGGGCCGGHGHHGKEDKNKPVDNNKLPEEKS